jgi:hypothetical protein
MRKKEETDRFPEFANKKGNPSEIQIIQPSVADAIGNAG